MVNNTIFGQGDTKKITEGSPAPRARGAGLPSVIFFVDQLTLVFVSHLRKSSFYSINITPLKFKEVKMGVDNGDGTFSTRDPLTGSTVTIGLDEEDGHNTQWAKHIEKIRQLNILRSKFVHPIMEETTFTRDDVGKIFVINPEKNAGRLMTNEEFIALNISEIGEWEEVSIIDIPPHA